MSIQDILCRIWLHKWGKFTIAERSEYINTGVTYFFQSRVCKHCGKFQEKIRDM